MASLSRRAFVGGLVGLGAAVLASGCSEAARPSRPVARPWRIGFVAGQSPRIGEPGGALRQSLIELGYVEGRDFLIVTRYAEGDRARLPGLAAELVNLPVDLIVTVGGGNPTRAAMQATRSIPIVFTALTDPVGQGLVPNLSRPGRNVTGVAGKSEYAGKRLELLKQAVPSLSRVAVLYHPGEAGQLSQFRAIESAARPLGIQVQPFANDTLVELLAGLDTVAKAGPDGLMECHGGTFYGRSYEHFGRLLDFAVKHRLPQMCQGADLVRAGALMGLGDNTAARYRYVAQLIDRILKDGADPGTLPVQVADAHGVTVNLTMARKLGFTFSESVLRQATEVVQ